MPDEGKRSKASPVGVFDLMGAARKYRSGGPGPKATLLAIIERMGETDGEWACWPSMQTVADDAEQTVRTVRRHVAAFESSGLLTRRVRGEAGGGRGANLLVLNVAVLLRGKPDTVSGGQTGHLTQANRTPEAEQTGHAVISHLSMEEPTEQPTERAVPSAFDEHFWPAWPPRDGKKLYRAKAEAIFSKLSLDDQRAAYRGARNLADAVASGGCFGIPDAFRWLRDRSWVEWQEPAQVRARPASPPIVRLSRAQEYFARQQAEARGITG